MIELKKYFKHRLKSKAWLQIMIVSVILALLPASFIYYGLIEASTINMLVSVITLAIGSIAATISIKKYWKNKRKQTISI